MAFVVTSEHNQIVLYIENIMENRMKRDYGGVGSIALTSWHIT